MKGEEKGGTSASKGERGIVLVDNKIYIVVHCSPPVRAGEEPSPV
jgi:hypothetical protein